MDVSILNAFSNFYILNPLHEQMILSSDDEDVQLNVRMWREWNDRQIEYGNKGLSLSLYMMHRRDEYLGQFGNNSLWSNATLRKIIQSQYNDEYLSYLSDEEDAEDKRTLCICDDRYQLEECIAEIMNQEIENGDIDTYSPVTNLIYHFINEDNEYMIADEDRNRPILYGVPLDEAIIIQDNMVNELLQSSYVNDGCRSVNRTIMLLYKIQSKKVIYGRE